MLPPDLRSSLRRSHKAGCSVVMLCLLLAGTWIYLHNNHSNNRLTQPYGPVTDIQKTSEFPKPVDVKLNPATKVILFAYYRGGSSFLGELFRENPDVFYWFEPLRAPVARWQKQFPIVEDIYVPQNGKHEMKLLFDQILTYLSDILHHILHCDVDSLEDYVLDTPFVTHAWTVPKMEPFVTCLKLNHIVSALGLGEEGEKNNQSTVQKCSHLMASECKKSGVVALKVVRMNMIMVEKLLVRDPDIRIVYYFRDPRGILLSRRAFDKIGDDASFYDVASRNLCQRMREDLNVLAVLRQKFSKQIFVDAYENMAINSTITAARIYKFLQRPMPTEVSDWLVNSENAKVGNASAAEHMFGTYGRNSADIANRWNLKLGKGNIDIITNNCQEVLSIINKIDIK